MNIPRDAFISHFQPVFQVHCLKLWHKGAKVPPEVLPRALHEWIATANGRIPLSLADFRVIVEPVIAELHRNGKGARPTAEELTGAVYDGLARAGVEVALGRRTGARGRSGALGCPVGPPDGPREPARLSGRDVVLAAMVGDDRGQKPIVSGVAVGLLDELRDFVGFALEAASAALLRPSFEAIEHAAVGSRDAAERQRTFGCIIH